MLPPSQSRAARLQASRRQARAAGPSPFGLEINPFEEATAGRLSRPLSALASATGCSRYCPRRKWTRASSATRSWSTPKGILAMPRCGMETPEGPSRFLRRGGGPVPSDSAISTAAVLVVQPARFCRGRIRRVEAMWRNTDARFCGRTAWIPARCPCARAHRAQALDGGNL